MNKRVCDICEGDLFKMKHVDGASTGFSSYYCNHFSSKSPFVVKKHFFSSLTLPMFFGRYQPDELEICSTCFEDFKEYILRKKVAKGSPKF